MHKHEKHPLTGCRPAQLLGPWAMEQTEYDRLYDSAMALIDAGQLEAAARESKAQAEDDAREPYQLDSDGIAHMTVSGVMTRYPHSMQSMIGGTSTLLLQQAVRQASRDPDVRGIMMHINSPGGACEGMEDLCREVARARGLKPMGAHVSASGTSAAYRLGIEADSITMDSTAFVGSVGAVLTPLRDTSELMRRSGITVHYAASGDRKTAGAPGTVVTAEHKAERDKLAKEIAAGFVTAVRTRRPQITEEQMADVSRAGLYGAQSAMSVGLVDGVSTTEEAIERFKQNLSTGNRSLQVASPTPAAAQERSSAMALTTEQLAQAKALPGCADITAENADGKLLAAAIGLQTNYDVKANAVASLERQLAEAKIDKAAQTNPAVLKAMASASRIHLKDAVAKQAITPAVGEALASSLIGTDENLSAAGLTPSASGECFATMVFSALAQNGAAPNVGKQAGAQPAPKATPGAPEEGPVSPERQAQLLGQTPLGMAVASAK